MLSDNRAVAQILARRNSHFDPDIADAFMAIHDEFKAIARRFRDSDADMQRKAEVRMQVGVVPGADTTR